MMRTSVRLILFATLAALACAPVPTAAQSAHGLEVSDPQWRYLRASEESNFPNSHPTGGLSVAASTSTVATHAASALFRNTGSKVVKAVTWEYLFFKDEQQTKLLRSHTFRNSQKIEPGTAARLRQWTIRTEASRHAAVRIVRIDYEDGTSWKATRAAGSAP